MAKFVDLLSDIEGQFATSDWTSQNISAFPANFRIPENTSEFVKLEVLPLRDNSDYGRCGIEGIVYVQIYVQANQGVKRLMEIADILDTILQAQTFSNGTQTQASSLNVLGIDKDNPELFRGDFAVNFTYYN
jgi:hypothetical protein